jgi:hypothetical protein
VRPYAEGEGPTDFKNSANYNQRFKEYMQAQLDFCKVDPHYGIEDTAENVEAFFKEKLIRMFDQI